MATISPLVDLIPVSTPQLSQVQALSETAIGCGIEGHIVNVKNHNAQLGSCGLPALIRPNNVVMTPLCESHFEIFTATSKALANVSSMITFGADDNEGNGRLALTGCDTPPPKTDPILMKRSKTVTRVVTSTYVPVRDLSTQSPTLREISPESELEFELELPRPDLAELERKIGDATLRASQQPQVSEGDEDSPFNRDGKVRLISSLTSELRTDEMIEEAFQHTDPEMKSMLEPSENPAVDPSLEDLKESCSKNLWRRFRELPTLAQVAIGSAVVATGISAVGGVAYAIRQAFSYGIGDKDALAKAKKEICNKVKINDGHKLKFKVPENGWFSVSYENSTRLNKTEPGSYGLDLGEYCEDLYGTSDLIAKCYTPKGETETIINYTSLADGIMVDFNDCQLTDSAPLPSQRCVIYPEEIEAFPDLCTAKFDGVLANYTPFNPCNPPLEIKFSIDPNVNKVLGYYPGKYLFSAGELQSGSPVESRIQSFVLNMDNCEEIKQNVLSQGITIRCAQDTGDTSYPLTLTQNNPNFGACSFKEEYPLAKQCIIDFEGSKDDCSKDIAS